MSPEYQSALHEHDAAIAAFHKARDAYRAIKIGDNEFLAALNAYKAALRRAQAHRRGRH
jgi:hypothetical protein